MSFPLSISSKTPGSAFEGALKFIPLYATYSKSAEIKAFFLKNNAAAVSLSITDIFKTRINSQYSSSDYFTQTYSRLRDPQMVKLNFSYRFGKLDVNLFKRKSSGGDSNATEGMQQ